ncbi:hypothetical protein [Symbiopectobacterium sp.]|uniref:hypothetical protein n=1 Tax=Symbiopectobacterium sp. TaxID=2952789 RepID=UPI003F3D9F80
MRMPTPALHEAPIVTGHPTTDAPAYGWIKQLSAQGRDLLAEPQQVDPAFSELVTVGRYKKISASFYLPHAPNNPAPGALYLRHVGFLGAQPPAVKGLRAVSFADTEDGVVEFTEDLDDSHDSLLLRLRALLNHYVGTPSDPPSLTTRTLAFSEPGVVNPHPTTESLTVEKTETEKQLEALRDGKLTLGIAGQGQAIPEPGAFHVHARPARFSGPGGLLEDFE